MSNEIATRPETAIEEDASKKLIGFLKKHENSIKKVLPKHLNEDRFAWLLVNSIRRTPKLVETSPASFFNAVLLASNMGLEIRQNSAYLIPYGKECQLVIDYRGKMELARNAGCGEIIVQLVRGGDYFDLKFSSNGREFVHKPLLFQSVNGRNSPVSEDERGEVVLVYGYASVRDKGYQFDYMTLGEVEAIRARAKSGCAKPFDHFGKHYDGLDLRGIRELDANSLPFKHPYRCPWVTDWDEMARKTMAHKLCKYLPMTPELLLSQEVDAAVLTGNAQPMAMETTTIRIDPEDEQPMMIEGTRADQERVRDTKLAEIRKTAAAKATESIAIDPEAVITDQEAEEISHALDAAGYDRKGKEKFYGDLKVNNAYGLTRAKADLAWVQIKGRPGKEA